jgi:hypothetical protein
VAVPLGPQRRFVLCQIHSIDHGAPLPTTVARRPGSGPHIGAVRELPQPPAHGVRGDRRPPRAPPPARLASRSASCAAQTNREPCSVPPPLPARSAHPTNAPDRGSAELPRQTQSPSPNQPACSVATPSSFRTPSDRDVARSVAENVALKSGANPILEPRTRGHLSRRRSRVRAFSRSASRLAFRPGRRQWREGRATVVPRTRFGEALLAEWRRAGGPVN